MTLHCNWKRIVRKAWSVKGMALAGVLTACEVILPLYVDCIPRNLFAVLSLIAITAAFVARLVAQKDIV